MVSKSLFIEANLEQPLTKEERKKQAAMAENRNTSSQMVRFEFLQALILLANAKYVSTKLCASLPEALLKLLDENVARVGDVEPLATYNPDLFRTYSIYNADVEATLSPHLTILQELYKAYNPTTAVKRRMNINDFQKLLSDANFFDEDFTRFVHSFVLVTSVTLPNVVGTRQNSRSSWPR
mmetsp:Transcript_5560/g.16822  ORF Transcript_5560/g.16822 Transcript_5560/m.16822 type:complete len:181 (-) Transcript_5560:964-1506(-)